MKKTVQSGFTLVEILVTILIMSISLAAIFQSFSASTRIAFKAAEIMEAERIAHNILRDDELLKETENSDEQSGDVKDNSQWKYVLTAKDIEINKTVVTYNTKGEVTDEEILTFEFPGMREITLCVKKKSTADAKSYCVSKWY